MSTTLPPLKDDEVCACGHWGRCHFRDEVQARVHGCMALVDSAYTVTNDRVCGCHRRRAPE